MRLIFVFLIFLSTLFSQEIKNITVQLKWKHQFQFAGFYMAKELGYYNDIGVDVEFRELDTSFNILKDLENGVVHFAIDDSSTIFYRLKGADIVALLPIFQSSPITLFTQKGLDTLESLQGKSIEFSSNELSNISINALLRSHNINVVSKLHSFNPKDFLEKKPDGIVGYLSNQPHYFKNNNIPYNQFTPKDYGFDFYGDMLFTSKKFAKQNPKFVKEFIEATKKGWEYAFANIPQTSQLIYDKYNSQNKTIKALIYEGNVLKDLSGFGVNFGEFKKEKIKEIGNTIAFIFPQKFKSTNLDDFVWNEKEDLINYYKNSYLKENKEFKVCVHENSFPVDGVENGKLNGISGDILNKIAQDFGFKLQAIQANNLKGTFKNVLDKKCDILTVTAQDAHRQYKVLNRTDFYVNSNLVIVTKIDKPFMESSSFFKNKKFVIKYKVFKDYLLQKYPDINVIVESDVEEAIKKLKHNEVDGFIVDNVSVDRVIQKYGYGDFKISGFIDEMEPIRGAFGVQKDSPELLEILNLGLSQFSKEELEAIKNKYKVTRYTTIVDNKIVIDVVIVFAVILVIIMIFIVILKRHNNELNEWINSTIEGVALFENGKIIKANNQLLNILGYENFDEIDKKTYYDFISPIDHHIIKENLKLNTEPYELTFVKKDGSLMNALVKGHTIKGTKKRISTVIDITELKNAQKSLALLNQTLEDRIKEEIAKNERHQTIMFQQAKLAETGMMLNMIAHQWRQPLNHLSLIFNSLILKHRKNSLDKDLIEKYKADFHTQLLYMSNTIDDFQNFFKPKREKETFLIKEMINTTFSLVKGLFEKNSIEFRLNSEEILRYYGFKNELAQVILSILNNAKDALIENKIENKKIDIKLEKKSKNIIIKITDNAKGVKDDYLEKIFDPYFSTKAEKNGTGLGLYMAKTIINKHFNGEIFAKNVDSGLEIKIIFPECEILN